MKHLVVSILTGSLLAMSLAGWVLADPINSQTVPLAATCTGLGSVTLYQEGASHTDAFLVGGSTAVVLLPANGASGLYAQAVAAGTTCAIEGFGTGPVVIR